ncbi:hypothetical protein [Microvirga roseola]|uniref:hypothetical protein n=1 Tax=Microvirga roseola TaxID=2883126 RepID=UPI001E53E977|nr:hypothetical protein [Microvirga roseola]
MNRDQQIERIALALYHAEGDGLSWDSEPEILKCEFRDLARAAISMLQEQAQVERPEFRSAA